MFGSSGEGELSEDTRLRLQIGSEFYNLMCMYNVLTFICCIRVSNKPGSEKIRGVRRGSDVEDYMEIGEEEEEEEELYLYSHAAFKSINVS